MSERLESLSHYLDNNMQQIFVLTPGWNKEEGVLLALVSVDWTDVVCDITACFHTQVVKGAF